ncbi:hypothetical protein NM208_g11027 [Fusarium decemcellulare]|uniref:Uncharacterized protein n=1 Tax=Fusarium decemcellulare TaxID=57161 RepID=A0ACC1RVU7_9HYPO|nr:hypothetical protein NM208_g11027 [Fusarium decemcellulare]
MGIIEAIELNLWEDFQRELQTGRVHARQPGIQRTALAVAARLDRRDMLHALMSLGSIDVNALDGDGATALYLAAWRGHKDVALSLLEHKDTDAGIMHNDGKTTALHHAFRLRDPNLVDKMIARSSNLSAFSPRTFWEIHEKDDSSIVQLSQIGRGWTIKNIEPDPYMPTEILLSQCDGIPTRCIVLSGVSIEVRERSVSISRSSSEWFCLTQKRTNGYISNSATIKCPVVVVESFNYGRFTFGWENIATAWTTKNAENQVVDYFTVGVFDSIPDKEKSCLETLLRELKRRWLDSCAKAEDELLKDWHIQLSSEGKRSSLSKLTDDSRQWHELRRGLRELQSQIDETRNSSPLFKKHCKAIDDEIEDFQKSITRRIDQHDNKLRELWQFEFALLSIQETESLRRLGWITFIFLPLMFVSFKMIESPRRNRDRTTEPCSICLDLAYSPQRVHQPRTTDGVSALLDLSIKYVRDFKKSVGAGCRICSFILDGVLYFGLPPDDNATIMVRMKQMGEPSIFLPSLYKTIQIYTPMGYPPALDAITNSLQLSGHPDSDEAYGFIHSCLEKCEKHQKCQPVSFSLPTRLIDVGALDDAEVRLVETVTLPQHPYVALSYCWGKAKVVTSITSNYESMKRGVTVSIFPQTIQDAIKVTRKLKYRYLWVDAICIIQDSVSDWEAESAKMASVYRDAVLTLSAAVSSAATEGFLDRRHLTAEEKPPYLVDWITRGGKKSILGARVIPGLETHTLDGDEDEALPLWFRGWTLQETCECEALEKASNSHSFKSLYSIGDPQEAYQHWQNTVEEYTCRSLTNSMDKLPAISGIAQVVQNLISSQYVAGLWVDNFISDLSWHLGTDWVGPSDVSTSSQYRAPTFSGASMNHGVTYWRSERWVSAGSCTVVKAESKVPGRNPLGQVESAYATLRGLLSRATLRAGDMNHVISSGDQSRYTVSCGGKDLRLYPDTTLESFEAMNQDGATERSIRRSPVGPSSKSALCETPVFLFYLGHRRGGRLGQGSNVLQASRWFLVLGKSNTDMSRYERLGMMIESCSTIPEISPTSEPSEPSKILKGFSEATITLV